MKVALGLSIAIAFCSLLLSSAAFVMAYDLYSKSQVSERQAMCEKQNLMDFFECMKD